MEHSPELPQVTKSMRTCYGPQSQGCLSKVILESNVTPNITRSSDSFSTVPPIVAGGDGGCILRNLETIIVLVLLAFNFTYQRSHHSLTLPKVSDQGLCYCNSNAWGWYNSHHGGVISITDQLIFQNGNSSEVYRRNYNEKKTQFCCTPDTTLTSLLR